MTGDGETVGGDGAYLIREGLGRVTVEIDTCMREEGGSTQGTPST